MRLGPWNLHEFLLEGRSAAFDNCCGDTPLALVPEIWASGSLETAESPGVCAMRL